MTRRIPIGAENRGLATACGAQLILTALDRGLYPSWDAYDRRSVALAEKLGLKFRIDNKELAAGMRAALGPLSFVEYRASRLFFC